MPAREQEFSKKKYIGCLISEDLTQKLSKGLFLPLTKLFFLHKIKLKILFVVLQIQKDISLFNFAAAEPGLSSS